MPYRSEDIKVCPKCNVKLLLYYEKREGPDKKLLFRRCPSCIEVFIIEINLKNKKKDRDAPNTE